MPGGHVFSVLFFVMLTVAGITSMVGLVESVTAWIEDRVGAPRHRSAVAVVASVAVLSVLSLLSYNVLGDLNFGGGNLNDSMDYFSNQILLPLGGLFIAIFAGWFMSRQAVREELADLSPRAFGLWYGLVRYVVPPALGIIFLMGITE